MGRFVEGADRSQLTLLPEFLNDGVIAASHFLGWTAGNLSMINALTERCGNLSSTRAGAQRPLSYMVDGIMALMPFRGPEKKPPALWPVWLILVAIAPIMAFFYMTRTGPQVPRALEPSRLAVTGEIAVVDGDTVRHQGQLYRLVGFDTPEKGDLARCEQERRLAEKATQRLRQLILSSNADLRRVSCECRPGEEGTSSCNYGRLCGSLTVGGRDVRRILINEGLAHPYVCSGGRCPQKQSWC